jgi:aminocarboxymuconate-semialdehyde decarboxylase
VHPYDRSIQIDLARRLNDDILAFAARRPDRLRATVALPLIDVEAALAELDRVRGHAMFAGVAMGSSLGKMPLNHKSLEPVWARLDALRCPVIEHPVYPENTEGLDEYELPIRVGFMFETTVALTRMIYAGIFERYPHFPYIVAHTGAALLMLMERLDNGFRIFPDCRRDISRLPSTFMRQLYYDSCSYSVDSLMLAHRMVGPERMMFGTDYPYIAHGDPSHVTALPISDNDKAAILGGNAARVFGLESTRARRAE